MIDTQFEAVVAAAAEEVERDKYRYYGAFARAAGRLRLEASVVVVLAKAVRELTAEELRTLVAFAQDQESPRPPPAPLRWVYFDRLYSLGLLQRPATGVMPRPAHLSPLGLLLAEVCSGE